MATVERTMAAAPISTAIACVMFGLAAPAYADMIMIASDGAIAMRVGAGAVRWHGRAEEAEPPADADLTDIPLPDSAVSPFRARSAPLVFAAAARRIAARHVVDVPRARRA